MKLILLAAMACLASLLCGCGSDGVDVMMENNGNYASVPMDSVRVSSHPPKDQYQEIAFLSLNAQPDDTPAMIGQKLQHRAGTLGANYVWVTGGMERLYLAPAIANTYSSGNAYGTGQATYDQYGNVTGSADVSAYGNSTTAVTPAHTYTRALISARALIVTSGNLQPNLNTPSAFGPNAP